MTEPLTPPRPRLDEALALVGRIVRWHRTKAEPMYVLCFALEVRHRFGYWDLLVIPLAGDGTYQVATSNLELHDQQGADAIVALIDHLQAQLKGTNG